MQIKLALFAAKNWKEFLIGLTLILTLIFVLFFGEQQPQNDTQFDGSSTATVSPLVLRYEPLVQKYAQKYGVGTYVQLLLAFMMQESGGRVPDVMQSSESIGLPPNTITDPEQSIDVGVRYFSSVLKSAGGDVKLALQSYNFGGGFIPYAKLNGGYSKEVAVAFSSMMAAKLHWPSYGDVNYVDNVLRYLSGGGAVSSFGFIQPLNGPITSGFGYRVDPMGAMAPQLHTGIDFGCSNQAKPIHAAKAGKIVKAGWSNPNDHSYGTGQRVWIQHSNVQTTVYGHMSLIEVVEGQTVAQGQEIGRCGTTGSSTGMHLHFEIKLNGTAIDPAPYLK